MGTIQSESRFAKIQVLTAILLVGFIVSAYVFHFLGTFLHLGYPHNIFLFDPVRAGDDLFSSIDTLKGGDVYANSGAIYFPACVMLIYPFSLFDQNVAFVIYALLVLTVTFPFVFYTFKKIGLNLRNNLIVSSVLVFLSYPLMFCLDRGNLEGVCFALFIGFIYAFRKQWFRWAAVAIGVAAATKTYPLIFGVLLLQKRKWREFIFAGALAVILNLVCAAILPGGIVSSFSRLFQNQHDFNQAIGMTFGSIPFGLSLFSWVKLSYYLFLDGMMPAYAFKLYSIPCAVLTIYCFYFAVRRVRSQWQTLFIAFAPWLVFPQISYAYKLIWLIAPACLMFEDSELSWIDVWCMALLLVPKTILATSMNETSLSIVVDPVLIILLATRIYLRNRRVIKDPHPSFAVASVT